MIENKVVNLTLTDVLDDGEGHKAEPIQVVLEYQEKGQFGIVITPLQEWLGEYRVVIENHEGDLMVHVWATDESVGNDPTHSIKIERKRG